VIWCCEREHRIEVEGELRRLWLSKEEPWNSQAFSKETGLGEFYTINFMFKHEPYDV